jgi:hypothetical protein
MENQYQSNQPELTTGEYFQLYELLNKMHLSGKLLGTEMEQLLWKAGLTKIEAGKYEAPSGEILSMIVKQ